MVLLVGLFASFAGLAQSPRDPDWGNWRYTDFKTSGIEFRTKCLSSSGSESRWAFQFRSRHDQTVDFGWRVEHRLEGTHRNAFADVERETLEPGEMSKAHKTTLFGTCANVRELNIEVRCVTVPGLEADCYKVTN